MDEVTSEIANDAQNQSVAEDLIPRAHATDLIKREKEAAYRKAQREFQAQIDQLKTGQTQQLGGMPQIPEDALNQAVDTKLEKRLKELEQQYNESLEQQKREEHIQYVNHQAKTYLEKMDKGAELADDYKEMTARFKPDRFKELFFLVNGYENTPALVYELGKNPEKLALFNSIIKDDPDLAKVMMDNLSDSIKFNQEAKANNKSAEPPLSRPKPSLAAGNDSGAMSLADLKKSPFLRG